MSLTPLNIHPIPHDQVESVTSLVRYSHPNTADQFPTTQAWAWEGGDALVSLTTCHVGAFTTLRLGAEVHSYPGSVASALEAFGFKSKVVC